jgi:hypothetical protein
MVTLDSIVLLPVAAGLRSTYTVVAELEV